MTQAEELEQLIGVRRSVIEMETPDTTRRNAVIGYCLMTLLLGVFSSMKILTLLGGVPSSPSTYQLRLSIDNYDLYIEKVNADLYTEIRGLYKDSLEQQSADCNATLTYVYEEELRVEKDAVDFTSTYCMDFTDRLWSYMESSGIIDLSDPTLETCADSYMDDVTKYISWLTNSSKCIEDKRDELSGMCVYSLFLQQPPSLCGADYKHWDAHQNIRWGVANNVKCFVVQRDLSTAAAEIPASAAIGYKDSVLARIDYDDDYFFGSNNMWDRVEIDIVSHNGLIDSLRSSFAAASQILQDNVIRMNAIHGEWASYYSYKSWLDWVPGLSFGSFHAAPDVSVITVNLDPVFDDIDDYIQSFDGNVKFFQNYNPPKVVEMDVELEVDLPEAPKVEFNAPVINLQSSELLVELIEKGDEKLEDIIGFMVLFDILLRIAQWLQDISVVFQEPRRDMTRFKSRLWRAIPMLLTHSSVLVYLGVGIYMLSTISSYSMVSTSVSQELGTHCSNQVLLQNSERLNEFRVEMSSQRGECDTVISGENAKLVDLNDRWVENVETPLLDFEDLYRSNNLQSTFYSYTGDLWLNVTEFHLPKSETIRLGQPGDFNPLTLVEEFEFPNASICTESVELLSVEHEYNDTMDEYREYVLRLLLIGAASLMGTRLITLGMSNILWMELTRGYTFDEEFTSAQLASKRSHKRARGLILIALGFMCFLVPLLTSPSYSTDSATIIYDESPEDARSGANGGFNSSQDIIAEVSPTQSPTSITTGNSSTLSPTENPSMSPSNSPITNPVASPTLTPTKTPIESPTSFPTMVPTEIPTLNPTASPTLMETDAPILSPTSHPTLSPTDTPTPGPTMSPSGNPTSNPTKSPTGTPSSSPTVVPTSSPTNSPTNNPTSSPTISPTNSPTVFPTKSPTVNPTKSPTLNPTETPTLRPTASPTVVPTASPSESPTMTPSVRPTTQSPTPHPTAPPSEAQVYTETLVINGPGPHYVSGVTISTTSGPCILVSSATDVIIEGVTLGPCAGNGIHITSSQGVTVRSSSITGGSSLIYALNSGDLNIDQNILVNAAGPFPRGQCVQTDKCTVPITITRNWCEQQLGESYPEDNINLHKTYGTAENPVLVKDNYIIGGGPSTTGCGILLADNGGSYQHVIGNTLVNPGQCGIGVAGGTNMLVEDNHIYGEALEWSNVGLYVWDYYNLPCSGITVRNNVVNWHNDENRRNDAWNSNTCGTVEGWSTNEFKATWLTPETAPVPEGVPNQ